MLDFLYQGDYYFWETWLRENNLHGLGKGIKR
jgi:hypothetical protein